jgi:hypothetical protein
LPEDGFAAAACLRGRWNWLCKPGREIPVDMPT